MNSHGRVTDSCLRCAFDSQAQTLCPGVTPRAGPGDRNFQREVTVVREGWGVAEEEEEEEDTVGVAGQQLLLSASIRKPRGDMGWRHGWGWGWVGGVMGREERSGWGVSTHPTPPPPPNKPKPKEECVGPPLLGPPPSPHCPSLPSSVHPLHCPLPSLPNPPPSIRPPSVHNTCCRRMVLHLHFDFRLGGNLEGTVRSNCEIANPDRAAATECVT